MSTSKKDYVPIADFYAGRSVFLTGFSGFLGKVVLEKLLYSCRHIDKVYVLIREKNNTSAEKRFKNVFEQPLFTRLKDERPGDLNKIVPVVGDLSLPNLGIDREVQNSFVDKVSVVIHSAASLKYDDPLEQAIDINLEGTRRMLHLCKLMPQLTSFVYVSTAFSNVDRKEIDEMIYPPPAELSDVQDLIKKYKAADEKMITKILNGKPNTYTFSKALAENLVKNYHGSIPATIVRPSSVGSSIKEPIPGWIDNWFSATGVIYVTGHGYNRVVYGRGSYVLDLIPADYVSNLIIVAAARGNKSQDLPVFNCCTSSCNPLSYLQLYKYTKNYHVANKNYDFYPTLVFTQNKWMFNLLTFVLQKLPAKMADIYLKAKGNKPRYARLQSKVIEIRDHQSKFTNGSWKMKAERTRSLYSSLSSGDKREFPFDPAMINWRQYIPVYVQGIRRFLLRK